RGGTRTTHRAMKRPFPTTRCRVRYTSANCVTRASIPLLRPLALPEQFYPVSASRVGTDRIQSVIAGQLRTTRYPPPRPAATLRAASVTPPLRLLLELAPEGRHTHTVLARLYRH